jgi:4-amino-4-deoxy-L-arabinose transferase-like glycosyltransferase
MLGLTGVFLVVGAKLIGLGAGDFGIVGLFSTDEQLAGQLVKTMILAGNLGLSHFYSYGPLDLYVARVLLLPYQLVGSVDERSIAVALRLVSLLAGAGCLTVTCALGNRLWNGWAGVAGTALLLCSATFLSWSTTAHPDMLQLLWLLLGIWSATMIMCTGSKDSARAWLLLGSVFAALAFATKYSGELLLPVLWIAAVASRAGRGRFRQSQTVLGIALDVGLSAVVFVAVAALLEIAALREWRSLVFQMTLEAGLAHGGHLLRAAGNPAGWISVLASTAVLGPVGLGTGLIGLIAWTVVDARTFLSQRKTVAWMRLPLELFTFGYLFFLLVWIGDLQARYALPILPGLAISAGGIIVWFWKRGGMWTVISVAVLGLMLLPLLRQTVDFVRAQTARMDDPSVASRVAAGRWMATRWPNDASVVADAYSYTPSSFTNVSQSFGLTRELVQSMRPDVIVTNSAIRNRFLDSSMAGEYIDGAAAYQDIAETYSDLESGRIRCYAFQNRFGPVTIYSREAGC